MGFSFLTGVITYIIGRRVSGEKYFFSLSISIGVVSGSASPVSPEFLFFSHPGAVLGAAEQGPETKWSLLQEQGT